MKLNQKHGKVAFALTTVAVATAVIAGTLIQLDPPVVVSTDDALNNAFKAKMGWISYKSDPTQLQYDVKAQLLVYADGPAGKQNIWIARSVDNGATWAQQQLTTNGGNALTGPAAAFLATNNKPNIYVAPIGVMTPINPLDLTKGYKGANALLTWTSSDCEGSEVQKINTNLLTGPQPYMCLWSARSLDGGVTWKKERLTEGDLDPDEDVPAGYLKSDATTGGFAISYQADPAGLQQGDAEGPGDGASGAKVSAGTNIYYTYLSKSAFEGAGTFKANIKQISDNADTTVGAPGASRANLSISGGTAVMAYEETKGTTDGAKWVVYHSFNYAAPPTNSAGTTISDAAKNARRVRFVLQGNDAIGDMEPGTSPNVPDGDAADGDTAGVHSLVIWRESESTEPASPANIVMRRGIKNTAVNGPTSTGFLPGDLSPAVSLSGTSTTSNALAHRAVLRGEFAAAAYDFTANKAAADLYTENYNLFVTRSTDGGATWSAPRNISNITDKSIRAVEPRMVGTPGTIKLPDGTPTSDPTDIQNKNVFFVGWGTETNEAVAKPLDIYITRTTDLGLNYERVQLLAEGVTEQSEAQLRSPPDGKTLGALWMQHDVTANTSDVVYRNGVQTTVPDPDLNLTASTTSFVAGSQGQVTFSILNKGTGDAKNVILRGNVPVGLTIVGVSDASLCQINGAAFSCTIPELMASQRSALAITVSSAAAGSYELATQVAGDVVEVDATDNTTTVAVSVTPAAATDSVSGGGCTVSKGNQPFDPMLPILATLSLVGLGLRRLRRH